MKWFKFGRKSAKIKALELEIEKLKKEITFLENKLNRRNARKRTISKANSKA